MKECAKVIIFEGIGGSGKSTQVAILKERLESEGYDVAALKFPDYNSPYEKEIKKYLNGDLKLSHITAAHLFVADRAHAKDKLVELAKTHDYILIDRYFYSNVFGLSVHPGFPHCFTDVLEAEMVLNPLLPDFTFLFSGDLLTLEVMRAQRSPDERNDINEINTSSQKRAMAYLEGVATGNPKWGVIGVTEGDGLAPKKQVSDLVLQVLKLKGLYHGPR